MEERSFIAIDLKSFYASVECRERNLDPMTTNLVVADPTRTEKTICLAVSPSLKAYGIPGRARLFEVIQKVKEVNEKRRRKAPGHQLRGESWNASELQNESMQVTYLTAPPRMALYMEYSTRIYQIYLKYIAPEDIHVYSIDEVMIDATSYLKTYGLTAKELASKMICEVMKETGITATAGVGTNLYLCKVAMDLVAKHMEPDEHGVRIAWLNERTYRELLWSHRPITDFWRVGKGYGDKLAQHGIYTMGDVARCSIGKPEDYHNEDLLYRLFGVNAELLIDHAWGWEPCTLKEVKAYRPETKSMGSGQVLSCAYEAEKARIVVLEMADQLALDLLDHGVVTDQLVLTVGYDIENTKNKGFQGEIQKDRYGRNIPKHAHGTIHLKRKSSSSRLFVEAAAELYDRIINPKLLVRRIQLTAERVVEEQEAKQEATYEQLDLFTDYRKEEEQKKKEEKDLEKERKLQQAMLSIKKKYGKNAVLKGRNFEEGATMQEKNKQIGGHKA